MIVHDALKALAPLWTKLHSQIASINEILDPHNKIIFDQSID
ncbi:hypothetical protein C7402_103459 [Paraburkholderia unamae]|uniref:Uncharacterized protein n=1 Tax=Paraburkholderia unamae TaxID=219649 RepID=A0ABX5KSX8_9BURK|nr:hypothetical protein C7402_103459 [Paraburkholderia unamae]